MNSSNGCLMKPSRPFAIFVLPLRRGGTAVSVGGGIRSLNVALRQPLDLYACVRPVRYFKGADSRVKHPERMNVVIYRENTEDVYIGIEWKSGTPEVKKLIEFLNKEMLGAENYRFVWIPAWPSSRFLRLEPSA